MNEREVFIAALERVDPAERRAYLDEACRGDEPLRRGVEALLDAHERADSFLEPPELPPLPPASPPAILGECVARLLQPHAADGSFPGTTTVPCYPPGLEPVREGPGTVLGPYRLLEQLGEGGFGVVFLAEQQEPLRRRVALKVIKPGMDTRQVVARFEAERQALALMDHPHIAKVLDGGETPGGLPFFVMELVKGVPITRFCDDNRLTPHERLGLFVDVCAAVQHAHQKGVIHRDLKPSNVLVASHDGTPVVKVIDFGIAKAVGPPLTDKTVYTQFMQLVGTPLYMSPEQAGMSALDVDTRSDIYALGVLLYELLTGATPFDPERFRQAAYDEIRRMIQEEEPPRPSARLSGAGPATATAAASRGSDPNRLKRFVRGELDWVVMKCLEKDRSRRYESAGGLARDVERFLRDEPVQACPPSAGYRLRKFLRRNKGPVLAAGLVLAALVSGIIGTTLGMIRATDAEAAAVTVAKQKERALKDREAALTAAHRSEHNAQDQLFGALLNQARALRFGGQAGQRFDGLKALAQATGIARARGFGEAEFLKLRGEAVACLALPDLRFERTLPGKVPHGYWLAFDPALRHYVYSDGRGNLSVRRVADGVETARMPGPDGPTAWVYLRFSPDGRWLGTTHAISGRPSQTAVWEFRRGKPGRKVFLELGHLGDFSPDSRLVAGTRADGVVTVCEVPSGREVQRFDQGLAGGGVIFHPDGRHLAVYLKSDPSALAVLDRETGKEVARYQTPADATGEPSWRRDGRLLAIPCGDQRIYVWDHDEKRLQSVLEGHTGRGILIQFSHAGDFLVSSSWDWTVRLWDPVSGRQLVQAAGGLRTTIRRDDRQAVSVTKDGHPKLWEVAGGWECRTLHHSSVGNGTARPGDWGPRGLDFSPDGRLLVSCSLDGTRLWDLTDFAAVASLPTGATETALFHPDGESLFTYGADGLSRWPIRREGERGAGPPGRVETLRVGPPRALDVPGNWPYAIMALDRRGERLAAVDYGNGRAIVLDLREPGRKLVLSHPGVIDCRLSPDGRWAVTGAPTKPGAEVCKVWDTASGEPVAWRAPAGESFHFFTRDGRWLVTSPPGGSPLNFWRTGSWQPSPPPVRHSPAVLDIRRVAPDGRLAFTWGGGPPRLLDVGTGKVLAALAPPRDVNAVTARFNPDGTRLAVASDNHTVHLWDLPALRRGLAGIGLDWELPPYPPAPAQSGRPLRVVVEPGDR